MLKRRTILAGLTALGLTLAVSTQVYGQSTSGPEAWQDVYDEAVAGATTVISAPSLLVGLLSDLLNIVYNLAGFWGG
ncbi:hypothetical protein FACHB389_04635 [Nostoc calcicola FACHB-389]|nr:hypothetical protein [Nostoc calcicola FACHB-3891]MDZ8059075.1 hypothetical protein [Nostoc sp. EkiNYC01]OKH41449.1 hypothetical protein FACHB389_04635 [Nostoc calcicola FACHB-389]